MKLEWNEAWFRNQLYLQKDILMEACDYTKPSGRIYYMTCSILEDENMDQIARFLTKKESEYSLVYHETVWPESHLNDGFFLAVLERNGTLDTPNLVQ